MNPKILHNPTVLANISVKMFNKLYVAIYLLKADRYFLSINENVGYIIIIEN